MSSFVFVLLALFLRIVANPLANVFQKQLTSLNLSAIGISFVTYGFLSVGCIFGIFFAELPALKPDFWLYAILASVVGAWGNALLVKALETGSLSVLGPINAYKSVVGMIVGMVLLKEIPSLLSIFGVGLIIYGSYWVLDTTAERFSWQLLKLSAIRYRLGAMVLTAIEAVFLKKVILASSASVAFMTWCVGGMLFTWLLMLWYRASGVEMLRRSIRWQYLQKFLPLVCCIGLMQFSTNYVFDYIPVGLALSLFQLSTLVSIGLGYRYFQETQIKQKLIGAIIMLLGSVLVILNE